MVESAHVVPRHRARPGLRREIGFIGLLWASGGSIIGSGWLFGAQGALAAAGPAAIISWVIGAVALVVLGRRESVEVIELRIFVAGESGVIGAARGVSVIAQSTARRRDRAT